MDDKVELNNGQTMPKIGFGTWDVTGSGAAEIIGQAIDVGYRLIDTAKLYGNEKEVGEAVRASGMPREEIFVTTKLWNSDQGYDSALSGFDASLGRLGLDDVDLYLIHSPASPRRGEAWRALTEIYQSGRAKAVGVSNYSIENLQEIFATSDLVPAVNQIEFHPFNYASQKDLVEFCLQHDIIVEAYSPLRHFAGEGDKIIEKVADKIGRSAPQVILRWCLQHGTAPLPRSTNIDHIKENLQVFDFELSDEDMRLIDDISA